MTLKSLLGQLPYTAELYDAILQRRPRYSLLKLEY